MTHSDHPLLHDPFPIVRDAAARGAVAVGLAGIGVIHLVDSVGKWHETRYMFWMYMLLIAAAVVLAAAVLLSRSRLPLAAAAGLAASAAIGYVLSRTTGLPSATGDIGNWTEPLGLASLFVEGAVVVIATGAALAPRPAVAASRTSATSRRQMAVAGT